MHGGKGETGGCRGVVAGCAEAGGRGQAAAVASAPTALCLIVG